MTGKNKHKCVHGKIPLSDAPDESRWGMIKGQSTKVLSRELTGVRA